MSISTIIALFIGASIFLGGLYYLLKEKEDKESRRIYQITTLTGAVLLVIFVLKALPVPV